MSIDFEKQKYMFLNGVRYLISDIKGFQVIRKKWTIILKLGEEREEKVVIYNFTKRFEDDRYKLRCLECYWKDLARKMELEEWSNKGLRGLENKLFTVFISSSRLILIFQQYIHFS